MSLAMAKKALLENRERFLNENQDPVMCNLHTALYQIVECLERIEAEQSAQRQVLSHFAARRR